MRKFYVSGLVYDGLLESALKNTKRKVADFVFRHDLLPVLDVCCGTGVQCYRIGKKSSGIAGLDLDLSTILYAKSKYPAIPFLCADATRIPFKDSSFKGAVISYSLHEKSPENRWLMLKEVRRVLDSEGKVVFVDFDNPWSRKSKIASLYVYGIERIAGQDHFNNGREFLEKGGLMAFLERYGLEDIESHRVELAQSSIVVARFGTRNVPLGEVYP